MIYYLIIGAAFGAGYGLIGFPARLDQFITELDRLKARGVR